MAKHGLVALGFWWVKTGVIDYADRHSARTRRWEARTHAYFLSYSFGSCCLVLGLLHGEAREVGRWVGRFVWWRYCFLDSGLSVAISLHV